MVAVICGGLVTGMLERAQQTLSDSEKADNTSIASLALLQKLTRPGALIGWSLCLKTLSSARFRWPQRTLSCDHHHGRMITRLHVAAQKSGVSNDESSVVAEESATSNKQPESGICHGQVVASHNSGRGVGSARLVCAAAVVEVRERVRV
eukprot:3783566-Rhodomonas_salina.2